MGKEISTEFWRGKKHLQNFGGERNIYRILVGKEISTEFWWGKKYLQNFGGESFCNTFCFGVFFYRLILAPSFFGGAAEYHKRLSIYVERFDCVLENTD